MFIPAGHASIPLIFSLYDISPLHDCTRSAGKVAGIFSRHMIGIGNLADNVCSNAGYVRYADKQRLLFVQDFYCTDHIFNVSPASLLQNAMPCARHQFMVIEVFKLLQPGQIARHKKHQSHRKSSVFRKLISGVSRPGSPGCPNLPP